MPWSKFKVLLPTDERTNRATNKCVGTKFKSFYLWVEGRTKSLTGDLVQNLSPTYGGRTNQVTNNYLGTKCNSFYLRVEGRTKLLISDLVQYLSPFTYGCISRRTNLVTHEPSHHQVPWSKFKSFYLRVEGRTSAVVKI